MPAETKWVVKKGEAFWPSKEMKKRAWVSDEAVYKKAAKDPVKFWSDMAKEGIEWFKPWTKAYTDSSPNFKWFLGAKLNASYNCLDRHVKGWRKNKAAIIWEPELKNEKVRVLTYQELYKEVNKFANALKNLGVKKGDRVSIYLPMIPEAQIAMLACARIGAIHSVVFSAFSAESLKTRIQDAESKVLITADGYYRRGQPVNLKANADEAVKDTTIEKIVVVKRTGGQTGMTEGRDVWWDEATKEVKPYCEPERMDSEDELFILYSSGSTGKPKGIVHDTGGYLTQAYWTAMWDFDLHDDDIFWCTADIGWVTGHTYACYGPLAAGATMLVYEGAPDWPQPDRFWEVAEKHGVTVFYTAPTAIRMFITFGDQWPQRHDLSSIRLLGTVGEPINESAWMWYFNTIGGGRCPIIDTWWQTETGGTLINVLPGVGPFIPTYAGRSFPGTKHDILDDNGKHVKSLEKGSLVQLPPFAPGMLRGLWKNEQKFIDTYWSKYGKAIYYTSDAAFFSEDGFIRIGGREDDVIKVAGHRLGTGEIENALDLHKDVAETAVIGMPHEIKGEVPLAFVTLKNGVTPSEKLVEELIQQVRKTIGPIAKPEKILFVEALPKTRSGKIMRRVLKALIANQPVGDTSTLANPESVEKLRKVVTEGLASERAKLVK